MPAIEFDLAADDITPSLAALADAALKEQILAAAGTVMVSHAQRAFDEPALRPSAWPPRKSGGSHPLMIKSGTLRQSIQALTGHDQVAVGSPVVYAATHQLGSKDGRIPARPYFPVLGDQLTGEAAAEIEEVAAILIGQAAGL